MNKGYLGDVDDLTDGINEHEIDGKCPLCGSDLILTGDNLEDWVQCENCNLEGSHDPEIGCDAIETFEGRKFENLPDCPNCGNNHGLKLVNLKSGLFQVGCFDGMSGCGLSGPKAKDEMKALEKFNEIFG